MNKRLLVLVSILPILILGIFPGQIIPRAHAALTGLVCIAAITDVTNKCPAGPPSFSGPLTTPNTLLRVPVMINHTDTFNGFDITVNSTRDSAGHLVLKPYGVDLTGSIMPLGSIPLAECVGSVTIGGSPGSCAVNATIDNPTTVRAAVISTASFLPQGATGLLFTALFSINGTSLPGGVGINFQNHCDPYPDASANDHLCVSIGNGSVLSAPENVQTGNFDNSNTLTLPYATLSTQSTNLGQSLVGAPTHALPTVTYTATSQNGFQTSSTPLLALAVSFNGTGPLRPTAALNMSALDLTGLAAHPFTQTGNVAANVPAGIYIATVTATYTTMDMITFTTDSLSAIYSLPVNVTDYVLSTSANTVSITPPGSQTVTMTIAPKASFNSLVKLGITIPQATASAGIGAMFNSYTISGGSGSSTLTITTSTNTPGGSFTLTVTSNSTLNGFTITHTKSITVNTVGFSISASTPPAQPVGAPASGTVTVTYMNGFTGTVSLTNNTATNLVCSSAISPSSLTTTGTASIMCTSTIVGAYILTIHATSGSESLSTTITFNFVVGYSISSSSPPASLVGAAVTATVTVTYVSGFLGTVVLTNTTATNLVCASAISPGSLTATGTASIQCLSTVSGIYTLTIHATSGSTSLSATLTFNFTIQIHDVAIAATAVVTPGSSTTVGTPVTVNVQIQNKGAQSENVTVYLLADNLTIASKTLVIAANSNQNVPLTWNTASYTAKTYKLSVSVQLPSGETNAENGQTTPLNGAVGTYTLNSANQSPTYDITTIAIIAGLMAAIVIVGTLLILRMRKKSSASTQPGSQ